MDPMRFYKRKRLTKRFTDFGYVNVPVLAEHEKKVKAYINLLIGGDYIKAFYPELELYPDAKPAENHHSDHTATAMPTPAASRARQE